MPDISVVLPIHNVERFVGEALSSLLQQTARVLQVIAVDDGSTDGSAAVLRRWVEPFARSDHQLQIVHQERGGAGAARNAALDRANGRLVAFLDADDRLHPTALQRLSEKLEAHGDLDLVFPLCRYIDVHGVPIGVRSAAANRRYRAADLLIDNPIHTGSGVMVRRDRVQQIGRFDTALPAAIDTDYWVRLTGGRGRTIGAVREVLVDYRKRPGQITGDWRRMRVGWESTVERVDAAGHGLTWTERRLGRARGALTWSSIAYAAGDHGAARRLLLEVWQADPLFAATSAPARMRTAACLASLLPAGSHQWLRAQLKRKTDARR